MDGTYSRHSGESAGRGQPTQVRAILSEVTHLRPELTAFFGCLYCAALRPEEAVALHSADLVLPPHGQGKLVLTGACPRTGSAWTSTGTPHEPRSLKHRPDGAVRVVPVPAVLVGLLRQHLREYGTAPDGRLFRGARGGILSESTYGRVWHAVRETALGPELAATPLARRPYEPAACRLVLVAERNHRACRSRRPSREQHPPPARRLRTLHRRPGRRHQPTDRRRPRPSGKPSPWAEQGVLQDGIGARNSARSASMSPERPAAVSFPGPSRGPATGLARQGTRSCAIWLAAHREAVSAAGMSGDTSQASSRPLRNASISVAVRRGSASARISPRS